ncbi:MAG TPA: hypothetical protein VIQ53_12045 [Inquilinus sp.]
MKAVVTIGSRQSDPVLSRAGSGFSRAPFPREQAGERECRKQGLLTTNVAEALMTAENASLDHAGAETGAPASCTVRKIVTIA